MPKGLLRCLPCLMCLLFLWSCATTPTGRTQLQFFSQQQLSQMGQVSYEEMRTEVPVERDSQVNRYVSCVVNSITTALPASVTQQRWQVTVFDQDDTVNAFALPGGYIGIYTGLLHVAQNPDQLAAVVGHEIAHVTANHPNARMSTQYATQAGLQVVDAFLRGRTGGSSQQIMAVLGVGSQVGVLLPFSRSQEREADVLGLQYMARAGFDPRQSIDLWRNMSQSGGQKPPEFLSTHPSDYSRIQGLQQQLPQAMDLYYQARQQGRIPRCRQPRGY